MVVAIPWASFFKFLYTIYMSKDQLYCSVDLEFTGFDPSKDQILEIGFAFFRVTEAGTEIVEEWSQVFKPTIEVHPKILGLTGITQQELGEAPDFNDYREFLQSKLGDAIIVGHNPVMDVKFLESYGIKLSGQVIDTLELVQFILPTHHSYNLENLVHYFGIQHHKAHRALGDAISTVHVLENLLQVHTQFADELKNELLSVIKRGEFSWAELLAIKLAKKDLQKNDSLNHLNTLEKLEAFELNDSAISLDGIIDDHEARVALGLQNKKSANEKYVLAVETPATVMKLWKEKLVHGVFSSEDTFSREAFEKFLQSASTKEELRFALKIIVWLHTNWQTEVVFDLNISFFGGQFRNFIVGGEPIVKDEAVLCLDYQTLQVSPEKFGNRKLVIIDIHNFEKFMSTGFGTRLSWNSVLYSLKLIYNPETDFGNFEVKEEVTNALIATDLFFGLVYMLLHQTLPGSQYAVVENLENNYTHVLNRLQRASQNLKEKFEAIQTKTGGHELGRSVKMLQSFFSHEEGRVKWVYIDEKNLSLADQPIDIATSVEEILKHFSTAQFTDTISDQSLLSYLVDRLGLHTEISELSKLFSNSLPRNIQVYSEQSELSDAELFKQITNLELPLVVVFDDASDIKEFYNEHFSEIKENAALFAQGYSGGGNKMFRNFSIKENSILFVTADFMGKQNYKIYAKNLIFKGLPAVELHHPYTNAVLNRWEDKHADLSLTFQLSKIIFALKKLKLNKKINVKLFSNTKNKFFVDKSY